MWLPDVADAERMTDVFSSHAEPLGLVDQVGTCRLLDARMTHPDRPESPLCRGWATYELHAADTASSETASSETASSETASSETASSAPILLYVKAFPTGASIAAWQQQCAAVPDTAARHLPSLDLIVWRFPEDPGLPALPMLVDPVDAVRHLPPQLRAELAGSAIEPSDLRIEVVRYQPETSATLRYDFDLGGSGSGLGGSGSDLGGSGSDLGGSGSDLGGSSKAAGVFAKHLAKNFGGGDFAATARRHLELWSLTERTPGLRIAEPLAADPQRGVLWTRTIVGQPMTSALQPERLRAVSYDVALVLASLHDCRVAVSEQIFVDDVLTEMRKKCRKLARAHPQIAREVSELMTALDGRRPHAGQETGRNLHGDFHVDQLVDAADGAFLVDLDSMVRGSPEMDLAEFVVDLCLRNLPEAVVREMVPLLLAAYESHAGHSLDTDLLRTFADAEFVNRCYRHLRRRAPGWSTALEHELARHDYVASVLPT